jgi:hypothetical protein
MKQKRNNHIWVTEVGTGMSVELNIAEIDKPYPVPACTKIDISGEEHSVLVEESPSEIAKLIADLYVTCRTCKWWEVHTPDDVEGYCLRHAPRATMVALGDGRTPLDCVEWPVTAYDSCCGEATPRKRGECGTCRKLKRTE